MTTDWIFDDDKLLAALREAVRATGPVPAEAMAAARAAFDLRRLDEELAELVYDSEKDAELIGTFRAQPSPVRALVFQSASLSVDVEVGPGYVLGQLVPAVPASITVETPTGEAAVVAVDDMGMFEAQSPTDGPLRLRLQPDDGAASVTQWFRR